MAEKSLQKTGLAVGATSWGVAVGARASGRGEGGVSPKLCFINSYLSRLNKIISPLYKYEF